MNTDSVEPAALEALQREIRSIKHPTRESELNARIASLKQANAELRVNAEKLTERMRQQRAELDNLKRPGRDSQPPCPAGEARSTKRYQAMRRAIRMLWQLASCEWVDQSNYRNTSIYARREMVWNKYAEGDKVSCHHCKTRLPFDKFTVDHLKPVALDGGDELANLRPSCEPCNRTRPLEAVT